MKWQTDILVSASRSRLMCGVSLCGRNDHHMAARCANCGADSSIRCVYPEDVPMCYECLTDGPAWIAAVLLAELLGVPA